MKLISKDSNKNYSKPYQQQGFLLATNINRGSDKFYFNPNWRIIGEFNGIFGDYLRKYNKLGI